jgi:hypothetical protein
MVLSSPGFHPGLFSRRPSGTIDALSRSIVRSDYAISQKLLVVGIAYHGNEAPLRESRRAMKVLGLPPKPPKTQLGWGTLYSCTG